GRSCHRLRAGYHRLGGCRRRQPGRRSGVRAGRGARHADLRRVAQCAAADSRGDLLRPPDRRSRRHRDRCDGSTAPQEANMICGRRPIDRVLGVALMVLLAASGCGGGGQSSNAPAGEKRLGFAVVPKSLDIPVFNYAKIGAERKAKELGNVDILWNAPTNPDQLKQKEVLESYITHRAAGIAISFLNGDFLPETIDRAIAAGIPVVTWDSDAPKSKRVAFYGVDDLASGRIMGEQAIRLLNGKGKIAIITSVGATNLQRRLDGVKEALAKAPDIQVVEVFDIKEDSVRCAEIMATGTRRYPDLAAWLSVGGWR